ncbi:HDOD domain-containing protein [Dactylosporangium roseum]|uniref:HDOD domain-containing protein n=1 Tax=Dactylosporangium roseum TaxID=47989 RepID=A0ABY5YX35_9ACTN|nr:response regulator [Dactylosporangium roseum]UWZ33418.1 HDOD domain-containing protein [Dactylosporangium roseum]
MTSETAASAGLPDARRAVVANGADARGEHPAAEAGGLGTTRQRVLFVDDEPRILDGLRRSLRGKRNEWDMAFATSGAEALDLLAESRCDVVVSDMRMPGMDGAELLTHVSERHPEVARVVLSGHTEQEAAIRVAVAGHRFLTKPSDAGSVVATVEQLTHRTSAAHGATVRRLAGAVRSLPTLPAHVGRLTAVLGAADVEIAEAALAASHDIGFTAKLLQLSNSVFFGARARVTSAESAINALGLPTVQALVKSGQLLWSSERWEPAVERELDVVWRHAVATARLVGLMASPANRPYAQAAALLQDIGWLAGLAHTRTGPDPRVDLAVVSGQGPAHREVGVELLHLWGLPYPIVAAVAERDLQHRPSSSGLGVAAAVRAAHLLVQRTDARDPRLSAHDDELAEFLTHPQLTAACTDWRGAAAEASEQAGRLSAR